MAKDKSEKKDKKDKKEKKDKTLAAENGVKKEKKEKKDKKKLDDSTTESLLEQIDQKPVDGDGDVDMDVNGSAALFSVPDSALVPFADPLVEGKDAKKVLKTVKKAAKQKALKRGVKEVVKAVRKTPPTNPTSTALPVGIVVLAADISPMDVISHIPVLCEDHGIPYVYLRSRAELGAAGSTKRPTSVVMISPSGSAKKGEADEDEEWSDVYKDFHKLVMKQEQRIRV